MHLKFLISTNHLCRTLKNLILQSDPQGMQEDVPLQDLPRKKKKKNSPKISQLNDKNDIYLSKATRVRIDRTINIEGVTSILFVVASKSVLITNLIKLNLINNSLIDNRSAKQKENPYLQDL
ncbi:hypothetical protein RCL_jg2402.t1 [Rhizophagus clarus]|uniref:Uncharacterized protein n=1 Tax=Rhizophagus clarus TaxID=94130 RepID=A0A8H3LME9_9GLOM|nr:hypothetical protein RCL_jg2402.t1 [Rhizophagus clarus]